MYAEKFSTWLFTEKPNRYIGMYVNKHGGFTCSFRRPNKTSGSAVVAANVTCYCDLVYRGHFGNFSSNGRPPSLLLSYTHTHTRWRNVITVTIEMSQLGPNRRNRIMGVSNHKRSQITCQVYFTWMMMRRQIPAPISDGSPYMPVITYTIAWPIVMIIPNTRNTQRNRSKSLYTLVLANLQSRAAHWIE